MDKEEILELLKPRATLVEKVTLFLVALITVMLAIIVYIIAPIEVTFFIGYTLFIYGIFFVLHLATRKKD